MPERSLMGAVIWRELLCRDVGAAQSFYGPLFGWDFVTEHATDFTWGQGAGDYTLIRANGAFHGGLAEVDAARETGWISYVMVGDVDAAAKEVATLGGTILRPPFDVAGVGRNAVACGPGGARFGLSTPAYEPSGTASAFVGDVLIAADPAAAQAFLTTMGVATGTGDVEIFPRPPGRDGAGLTGAGLTGDELTGTDLWLPVIGAPDQRLDDRTMTSGSPSFTATMPDAPESIGAYSLRLDPTGAHFATPAVQS